MRRCNDLKKTLVFDRRFEVRRVRFEAHAGAFGSYNSCMFPMDSDDFTLCLATATLGGGGSGVSRGSWRHTMGNLSLGRFGFLLTKQTRNCHIQYGLGGRPARATLDVYIRWARTCVHTCVCLVTFEAPKDIRLVSDFSLFMEKGLRHQRPLKFNHRHADRCNLHSRPRGS